MAKTGKRREPAQIAKDRRLMADLYLQGWLQADIAEKLGIDQSTVSRDLKALHKVWLASALLNFDKAKSRELAKVDRLEREYWTAWQRSCEDAEALRQEGGAKNVEKVIKTARSQAGDPRFLTGVQWCIEKRCKIFGIDAPVRTDVTSGGEPIAISQHFEIALERAYDDSTGQLSENGSESGLPGATGAELPPG